MKYKVYRRRWLVLGIVCVLPFVQIYTFDGFTTLNRVLSEYYHVTPAYIDILAVIGHLLYFPIGIAIAFTSDLLTLRKVLLGCLGTVTCGAAICAIGFMSRRLFWLTACGRLVMSSSSGLTFVLLVIVAAKWFPRDETAIAFALPYSMITLAAMTSSLVFPFAIPRYNETEAIAEEDWRKGPEFVKVFYSATFAAVAVIVFTCTVMAALYVADRPPTPPSRAEEQIILAERHKSTDKICLRNRLTGPWKVVNTREFILLTLAACLNQSVLAIQIILQPSAIFDTFPEMDNTLGGKILLAGSVSSSISIVVFGRVLDRFKLFKPFTLVANIGCLISSASIYLGHRYKVLPVLWVAYPAADISFNVFIQSVIEFMLEATYPANKLLLMSIRQTGTNLAIFLYTIVGRIVLQNWGAANASLVPVLSVIISIVAVICVKADYKRLQSSLPDTETDKLNVNPSEK